MKNTIPKPTNEKILSYSPGSTEKNSLKTKIKELKSEKIYIPLIINGKKVETGIMGKIICPHDHNKILGEFHQATEKEVKMAIESSLDAWQSWSILDLNARSIIFLKAADLLSGPWRDKINAATMLNMSKNVFQSEIDAACELIDFFRFNAWYAQELAENQPMYSPDGTQNSLEMRPLEGFIFAISPFNFTSIG